MRHSDSLPSTDLLQRLWGGGLAGGGLDADEDTNGHVDNFCCFASPGHVILAWTDVDQPNETGSPNNYERCRQAEEYLQSIKDAKGRTIEITKHGNVRETKGVRHFFAHLTGFAPLLSFFKKKNIIMTSGAILLVEGSLYSGTNRKGSAHENPDESVHCDPERIQNREC